MRLMLAVRMLRVKTTHGLKPGVQVEACNYLTSSSTPVACEASKTRASGFESPVEHQCNSNSSAGFGDLSRIASEAWPVY